MVNKTSRLCTHLKCVKSKDKFLTRDVYTRLLLHNHQQHIYTHTHTPRVNPYYFMRKPALLSMYNTPPQEGRFKLKYSAAVKHEKNAEAAEAGEAKENLHLHTRKKIKLRRVHTTRSWACCILELGSASIPSSLGNRCRGPYKTLLSLLLLLLLSSS